MSFINSPYDTSGKVQKPRIRIMTNGVQLPWPITVSMKKTNNLTADTFDLVFPLYDPFYDIDFWQTQTSMFVDIQLGFIPMTGQQTETSSISWKSILTGQVDSIDLDLSNGTVTCNGRDLASNFIDTKTADTFINKTSSQIIQQLAANHGMASDVDATSILAGRYYAQDHTNLTKGKFSQSITEWDLMTFLARKENYDLYVQGQTVYFKQVQDAGNSANAAVWGVAAPQFDIGNNTGVLTNASNVNNLRLHRNFTLGKDIKVVVQGWHSKKGTSFKAVAERKGNGSVSGGSVQEFVFNRHNITLADAQQYANSMLSDISKHEYVLTWDEPASMDITPRTLVSLLDTNSGFDTTYYIESIDYHYDLRTGFVMDVKAKNFNPANQSTV